MNREDRAQLILSVILVAVAGSVDAIGFLKLGHLFVSYMSGDSTQFAVYASRFSWREAAPPAAVVVLFLIGIIAGRLIGRAAKEWRHSVVILVESVLLAIAAVIPPHDFWGVVPVVLAMGAQNAALHKAGKEKGSLTYITGTLVSFAEKFADALSGSEPEERWAWIPDLLLWMGLILGAVCGAMGYDRFRFKALLVPASVLVVVAAVLAEQVIRRRRSLR
jgi:uncharacterized membrane protein YoaK (UPF0700 family)